MKASPLVGRQGAGALRFAPLLLLLAVLAGCASDSVRRNPAAAAATTRYWVNLRGGAPLDPAAIPNVADRGLYVVNQLKSAAAASQAPLISFLQQHNVRFQPFWITNSVVVEADTETLKQIAARPDVKSIEPDETIQLDDPPDPAFASPHPDAYSTGLTVEWNVQRTRAPEVWDTYDDRGQDVIVGVVDTGFAPHPALNDRYRGYWADMIPGDRTECLRGPCDGNGHGTHVTGTILGKFDNHVYGVAPEATFVSCRALNDGGSGTWSTIIGCYQWFTSLPIEVRPQIVSQSLGGGTSTAVNDANAAMVAAGILPVAAAGNTGGCKTVGSPGGAPGVLTVGALANQSNGIASFSSGGPGVDSIYKPEVVAGGQGVTSTWLGGGYRTISGTSMATPAVSGVAALVISAAPSYFRVLDNQKVDELKSIMLITANKDVDAGTRSTTCGAGYPNNVTGWGEIDAYQAVGFAKFAHPEKPLKTRPR